MTEQLVFSHVNFTGVVFYIEQAFEDEVGMGEIREHSKEIRGVLAGAICELVQFRDCHEEGKRANK